jgi:hypothetical protein
MSNRHKGIAKMLLDHGASPEAKTSSGRTAFDFVAPDSDLSLYLHDSGYNIGNAGVTDDFYSPGFSQDKFEEEIAENELRRRMMMESARDLEVDLGNVGMDDQPEVRLAPLYTTYRDVTAFANISNSRSMSLRTTSKSSTGHDVSTTRCSSFKKTSWTAFWISS